MTARAVVIGLALGVFIAGFTYFNDHVIRQTYLINNHLPAPVFVLGLLLLALNPLLQRSGVAAPFRPTEIAVVLMMGLAVCGWPGTSYFRFFTHLMAVPAHRVEERPDWRATGVLSYAPGGPPLIAEGHLVDADGLLARLRASDEPDAAARHVSDRIRGQLTLLRPSPGGQLTPGERGKLVRTLNALIDDPLFADHATLAGVAAELPAVTREDHASRNRAILEAIFPGHIRPQTPGEGVLLANGRFDARATAPLLTGTPGDAVLGDVPWATWWPTLRLWGGVSVLTTLAVLCLVLIVHPQWSARELLSYPTVRFVQELTRPGRGALPVIFTDRLFWGALGSVLAIHTLSGLHAWFPSMPMIPLQFDFSGLGQLFPTAQRIEGFSMVTRPWIFPSVIGFGYFISARTAASLGLAGVLWVLLGTVLLASGIGVTNHRYSLNAEGPALRAGAYLGMTLAILYIGRRYYAAVALRAAGIGRSDEAPAYAARALWGMVVFSLAAVAMLHHYASLSPFTGIVLIGLVLIASLVLMRMNAETGLFYAQPDWHASALLGGIVGLQFVGPEPLIVLMIGSALLMPEPREGFSPYLLNALRLGDGVGTVPPRRGALIIGAMVLVGFGVALLATLGLQYRHGLDAVDIWAPTVPHDIFSFASDAINRLSVRDELTPAMTLTGLDRLSLLSHDNGTLTCIVFGMAAVLICSAGRLRWAWWPLHPVVFAVWGTYSAFIFSASFLLAALVKSTLVRLAGERAYAALRPLMVGLIAGDLVAILVWSAIGAAYFAWTGHTPSAWYILPR